jgi:pilus assembly protein CpaB
VFIAQAWLNRQAEMRARSIDAQKKPMATQTIVVAAKPLRFGAELSSMSQNVRVLAVDQLADERSEKPSVAKAVTLEVEQVSAQKLALASTVGTLSLALRKAGEATAANTRRVTLSDLPKANVSDDRFSTIAVVRGGQRFEYSVPTEGERGAVVSAGAR